MSASDDALIIEYARHFGLARHFRPDYAANLLAELAFTAPVLLTELTHDCDGLFDRLDQEYELLIEQSDQPPIKVSKRAFDILECCQVPNEIDIDTIYRNYASNHKSISRLTLDEPLLIIGGGEPRRDARRIRDGIDLRLLLQMRVAQVKTKYIEAKHGLLDDFATDFDNAMSLIYSELTTTTTSLTTTSLEILRSAVTKWDDHTSRAVAIESTLPKRHLRREKDIEALLDEKDLCEWLQGDIDIDTSTNQVQIEALETMIPTWEDIIDDFDWTKDISGSANINTESHVDEKLLLPRATSPVAPVQQIISADDNEPLAKVAVHNQCNIKAVNATAPDSMDTDSDDPGGVCDAKGSVSTKASSSDPTATNSTSSMATACHSEPNVLKLAVPRLEAYSLRWKGCNLSPMVRQIADNAAMNSLNHQLAPLSKLLAVETPVTEPAEDKMVVDHSALQRFLGKPKAPIRSEQLLWKKPGLRLLDSEDESDDKLLTIGPSEILVSIEGDHNQDGFGTGAKLSQEGRRGNQMTGGTDSINQRLMPCTATQWFNTPKKPVVERRPAMAGPWKLRLSRSAAPTTTE